MPNVVKARRAVLTRIRLALVDIIHAVFAGIAGIAVAIERANRVCALAFGANVLILTAFVDVLVTVFALKVL